MGKLVTYITILIFIDLFFIATGQICAEGACTLSSIIFDALLNIEDATVGSFFSNLIGTVDNLFNSGIGIAALLAGTAVLVGSIFTKELRILLIPVMFALALITSDFVIISSRLIQLNGVLGIMIMAPIIIIYMLTVVEWWIGKD